MADIRRHSAYTTESLHYGIGNATRLASETFVQRCRGLSSGKHQRATLAANPHVSYGYAEQPHL